jgi:hypothetical protein
LETVQLKFELTGPQHVEVLGALSPDIGIAGDNDMNAVVCD